MISFAYTNGIGELIEDIWNVSLDLICCHVEFQSSGEIVLTDVECVQCLGEILFSRK